MQHQMALINDHPMVKLFEDTAAKPVEQAFLLQQKALYDGKKSEPLIIR